MSALATLRGVSKTYMKGKESVDVLHELDLDIPEGDFIAIMGPSGSGKTTLLNLLGGLDRPTVGTVTVGDAELSSMSNNQLSRWRSNNVGFIFQFYNLLPVLSAQKNVELPLLLTSFGGAERAKRAQIALDIVGLADRASHHPRELSGGQEQRVAIARAIVSDPSLLLCDEPTGDLDRETADEILKLLQTLNKEHGKTIVMVTHDAQAAEYANRTLHCDKGTLETREAA
ncbi:MAG: ABC transporter ATP-binding protein [Woeseiaceae bacterium]|nr:ABC transporter ATP-binding protein [Woeseiaceae bacterium]